MISKKKLENKKSNNVSVMKEQNASQVSLKPTNEDPPEYKIDFCHAIPVVRPCNTCCSVNINNQIKN